MNTQLIQLLVLAGIAVFLILRLRGVLGSREGFERPAEARPPSPADRVADEEAEMDRDITDHVDADSPSAAALQEMKAEEPNFAVGEFLQGSKGAYEMILMAFENGDLADVKDFLGNDVYEAFAGVVEDRASRGLTVEANFIGVRETTLVEARFDSVELIAELDVRFIGEMTSLVRDNAGDIIEGSASEIKRQRDVWTFARPMGHPDPNWQLVATGE